MPRPPRPTRSTSRWRRARIRWAEAMMARKYTRYPKKMFYIFVAPWLVGFTLLTALPLVYGFLVSLTNFDGSSPRWKWVGMRNYVELFSDGDAWAALLRTLAFTAIVVPFSVAGSLGL